MRGYVITTGTIFGLIVIAHLLRMITEDHQLATDPFYLAITVTAAGLALWAWRVARPAAH